MTRAQIEAAVLTSPHREGRWSQMRRVYGIEDYLHICGDRMSARQAALRLGRSERTVTRYRAALREASADTCPGCDAPDGRWCHPWCPWFKGGEA